MPHVVLERDAELERVAAQLPRGALRWRHAVLKTEAVWRRIDHPALLVEGVVVESSRPQHPIALVTPREQRLVIRLWPVVEVERTDAVRRWVAVVAGGCARLGAGGVVTTNLDDDVWTDVPGLSHTARSGY